MFGRSGFLGGRLQEGLWGRAATMDVAGSISASFRVAMAALN